MPISDDDLQSEYRFDYRKARFNRFAVKDNVGKLKYEPIEGRLTKSAL
ncbi:hypothetical protein HC928_05660 [bacterium]|nr:hypothetical protein [bacterium]